MKKHILVNITILFSVLVVLCSLVFTIYMYKTNSNDGTPYIVIIKDKEVIEEIDYKHLDSTLEYVYNIDGYPEGKVIIKVYNKGAFFVESICPDKLCIKRGLISENSNFPLSTCIYANITIELRYK